MAAKKAQTKATKNTKPKAAPKRAPATGGTPPAAAQAMNPPPGRASVENIVVPAPPAMAQQMAQQAVSAKIQLLDAIASQHNQPGHYAVVRADEAPNPYAVRRPTGITELDIDLGGGWPAGGLCFASGEDNVGKSWLLFLTMAMQQKIYGQQCIQAMAITEGGFAYDTAMWCGLRISVPDDIIHAWNQWREQRGLVPYTPDEIAAFKYQVGHFRIIRGDTGEEVLQIVLDFAASKACSIIALDSIQGLQPVADAGKEITDTEKMAAHATMMGRFFKKYIPTTTGLNGVNETTLLMTQQMRHNMQKANAPSHLQKYLPDAVVTGARSTRHYKLVDLVISNGATIKQDVAGVGKVAVGKVLKWETEKGKAGTHDNITGEVNYRYDIPGGVDTIQTIIDAGTRRGVIQKANNKIQVVQLDTGRVLSDYTAPSMKAFKQAMAVDSDFELAIRTEVLAAAGKQCIFRSL